MIQHLFNAGAEQQIRQRVVTEQTGPSTRYVLDMHRRQFLAVASTVLIAGCSTGDETTLTDTNGPIDTPAPEPEPESGLESNATATPAPVDLEGVNVTAESPEVSLSVDYNTTVTEQIPTSPPTLADPGSKWLAVRMRISNTGDSERELTAYQYIVATDNEIHEPVATRTDWSLFRAGDVGAQWLGRTNRRQVG